MPDLLSCCNCLKIKRKKTGTQFAIRQSMIYMAKSLKDYVFEKIKFALEISPVIRFLKSLPSYSLSLAQIYIPNLEASCLF